MLFPDERRIHDWLTFLRRAMATWWLVDITPPRTSQEAEEMKEKWKRKAQNMFLVPSVNFRCPMLTFQYSEFLSQFWSYWPCDYTIMEPRTWSTSQSSSDENWPSSHRDIQPTIQMLISLVTMESASLLACYSTVAADHDYTLLKCQPLSRLPDTAWYIPSLPASSVPFVLGQCILLSLLSCLFFGHLRSIGRLERSYLVVTVSPEPTDYGPCLLCPSQVFLPILFIMLPRLQWIQHIYLAPFLGALIGRRTLSCPFLEESSSRETIFPSLQHLEHWHYASVHQKSMQPPQMTPIN